MAANISMWIYNISTFSGFLGFTIHEKMVALERDREENDRVFPIPATAPPLPTGTLSSPIPIPLFIVAAVVGVTSSISGRFDLINSVLIQSVYDSITE